ncbi:MAG: AAA family ATPase [Steroidobacteraceae bacterium]
MAVANSVGENAADEGEARFHIRCGFEILEKPVPARWLLRPYLEESVLALLYGDLGTLKSFLGLHWSLTLAAKGMPALYLSAEGKGLERRIRGWCLRHDPKRKPEQVMFSLPFYAIEQAFALPGGEELAALEHAVESQAVPPRLIVVDTLNRYGGILDENRASDVAAFVTAVDRLRLRFGATILIVHHVGHAVKDRARGSYALMAATDAHFLVERPDSAKLLIRVTTGRLKDSESPPPLTLEADVVDLGDLDEDGQPRTTLALRPSDQTIEPLRRRPTGKRQAELLRLLEKEHEQGNVVWPDAELRKLAREKFRMHRNSARDAILGLHTAGYLKASIGGAMLANPPESTECTK